MPGPRRPAHRRRARRCGCGSPGPRPVEGRDTSRRASRSTRAAADVSRVVREDRLPGSEVDATAAPDAARLTPCTCRARRGAAGARRPLRRARRGRRGARDGEDASCDAGTAPPLLAAWPRRQGSWVVTVAQDGPPGPCPALLEARKIRLDPAHELRDRQDDRTIAPVRAGSPSCSTIAELLGVRSADASPGSSETLTDGYAQRARTRGGAAAGRAAASRGARREVNGHDRPARPRCRTLSRRLRPRPTSSSSGCARARPSCAAASRAAAPRSAGLLDDPAADRVDRRLDAVLDLELHQDVRDVVLDRLRADVQLAPRSGRCPCRSRSASAPRSRGRRARSGSSPRSPAACSWRGAAGAPSPRSAARSATRRARPARMPAISSWIDESLSR